MSSAELETVRSIKELCGYVAYDPVEEEERSASGARAPATYVLPDGRRIEVGAERFRAAEVMMLPYEGMRVWMPYEGGGGDAATFGP